MKSLIILEAEVESQEELELIFNRLCIDQDDIDAGGYTSKEETIDSIYEIMSETLKTEEGETEETE